MTPNITSHPKSGIGTWTDAEIKRVLTHGVARDVAWLRTIPPIE